MRSVDLVEDDLRLEALGVLEEPVHELGTLHAHGVGGPVVHVGRGHELPALGEAGDEARFQVGAGGIHRRAVAGGAGAEDEEARVGSGHSRGKCCRFFAFKPRLSHRVLGAMCLNSRL
jgi:hypothetical protein